VAQEFSNRKKVVGKEKNRVQAHRLEEVVVWEGGRIEGKRAFMAGGRSVNGGGINFGKGKQLESRGVGGSVRGRSSLDTGGGTRCQGGDKIRF